MELGQALTNMAWMLIPAVIYALVMRFRRHLGFAEITERLGLRLGPARWYAIASGVAIPTAVLSIAMSSLTSRFEGSMLTPYLDVPVSPGLVAMAFNYGFIATGLPEELLFRGLIGGALFRRTSFRRANTIQALIFMAPHLLLLLVAPTLWPFATFGIFGLGLVLGWLRERSGSIGPPALVHAAGNVAGALAVMKWS